VKRREEKRREEKKRREKKRREEKRREEKRREEKRREEERTESKLTHCVDFVREVDRQNFLRTGIEANFLLRRWPKHLWEAPHFLQEMLGTSLLHCAKNKVIGNRNQLPPIQVLVQVTLTSSVLICNAL